ncbi:uncharacterized protein QC763_204855 [Podospora pseudopauciseta]|uniref:Uncharacterized protein n=1 Tax=Podospora pseudopauciseta TaxID=2093780 RepID=A0ABR0HP74_9PEZI|nr:hypothetical protein QC763_204855 [Podospora pseudopauciseta]
MCQTYQSQTGCHVESHPFCAWSNPVLLPCETNCGLPTVPDWIEDVRCDIYSPICPLCVEAHGPNGVLDSVPAFLGSPSTPSSTMDEVDEDFIENIREDAISSIQEAEYIANEYWIAEPTELSLDYTELDLSKTAVVEGEVLLPEARRCLIVEGVPEPEDLALTPTDTIVFRF